MKSGFSLIIVSCAAFLFFMTQVFAQDFSLDEFEEDVVGGVESQKSIEVEIEIKKKGDSLTSEDEDIEKIEVTGSHIKRIDIEGPSPIQIIDKKQLERSGFNSVSDVLRGTTGNSFGSSRESSGSNAAGVATVSLRGMGADKTLVLLNGKRLPSDAVVGAVDLNLIPMAAVKRVEILKDGASATYGSDALGGVVNIITYKDYNGTDISYSKSKTTLGGGDTETISLITGSATAKSSLITVVSYRNNGGIASSERDWTKVGESIFSNPPNFYDDDGVLKADEDCDSSLVQNLGGGEEACIFNYADYSTEIPSLTQLSAMSLFEYQTDSDITIFGRVNFSRKKTIWHYAPATLRTTISAATAAGLSIGSNYSSGDVMIFYRTQGLGNRVSDIETNAVGYQVGAKGSLTDSWDWEFTLDRNRVRRIDLGLSGYGLVSEALSLIDSSSFNPFNDYSASNNLDDAKYEPWEASESKLEMVELKASGEILEVKNGVIAGAIGIQTLEASFVDTLDSLSISGDVFGSAGSSGGGERRTQSVYSEVSIPLLEGMELQVAARFDHFSDFGDTTNPKVGFRYQVNKKVMLRASWGTGFKAPSLNDLYAAESDGNPTFIDAVQCDYQKTNTPTVTPACDPKQYNVTSSGNDGLMEETSTSYNIGMVYQHSKKTSIGFDFWNTELQNLIGISYGAMTQAELDGIDLSAYGITVTRNSTSQKIETIEAPLQNLSAQEIQGLDAKFDYQGDKFSLTYNYGILFHFKQESFPGTGFEDSLGSNGAPEWRSNIAVSFNLDSITKSLRNSTLSFLISTISKHEKSVAEDGNVEQYSTVDMSFAKLLPKMNASFSFGIRNLFNHHAPLDDSNINNQLDAGLYSPRGPVVFAGYKQKF